MAKLRADARAEHQRQRAEDGGDRRHQDRAQAQETGLIDRLARGQTLDALRVQREIDHHDRVLFDDADQQHNADHADDVEPRARRPCSASSAPMPAEGSVERIVIGWMKLS